MLRPEQIAFLENNPVARKLFYRSTRIDRTRADDMYRFLKEAYTRHFPVILSAEVGGVSCSVTVSFDPDGPGYGLYDYLRQWVIAMRMRDGLMIDQMTELWPDLPQWYIDEIEKRLPEIDPEGP